MPRRSLLVVLGLVLVTTAAGAESVPVDRTLVRFWAPELGGAKTPRFVFERELAFEARLEALADPDHTGDESFRERHVTLALERHIAETLLAGLRIDPEPSAEEVAKQTEAARAMLFQRAGGLSRVERAAEAEGLTAREVRTMLRRQARASLYLDRMVAPMLEPAPAELRTLHRSGQTPFTQQPFEAVKPALARWYAAERLTLAVMSYYQGARVRLRTQILAPLPPRRR